METVRNLTNQEIKWSRHHFLYHCAKPRDKRPQIMGYAIGDKVQYNGEGYRLYDWQADDNYPEGAYAILIRSGKLTEGVCVHNLTMLFHA